MDLVGPIHWLLLTVKRRIGHGTLKCAVQDPHARRAARDAEGVGGSLMLRPVRHGTLITAIGCRGGEPNRRTPMRRLSVIRNAVLASGIVAALLAGSVAHAADAEPKPAGTAPISNAASGPSISADGRYVAFASLARDLVAGDTNRADDVFVRDRQTGVITRVSVDSAGNQANNVSRNPSISADGRYVAFESFATNLVAGDTNRYRDIFVHDLQTGETTRVSVASHGEQSDSESFHSSISADGRFVAFDSPASNLVFGDTNDIHDVFVRDRQTGETTRVSVDSNGRQGDDISQLPSISADGRYVAFSSGAKTLSLFPDNNHADDVFVHDQLTGYTDRISVGVDGNEGNSASRTATISADGRFVAFESTASNLVAGDTGGPIDTDIFLYDRVTRTTTQVNLGPDGLSDSKTPGQERTTLSADGRYIAFVSGEDKLVTGDTNSSWDVYVRDRVTATTTRVSVANDGSQSDGYSYSPSISADGHHVAFTTSATNLGGDGTSRKFNLYVRGLGD
ncbi:TolB family protein [Streptomyces sp. NPDC060028]|uniref:TolB family protein n=1 Tax=Streptomyces sp. NPDC060028 TaxID=3347041 RepID=UPI0036C48655